MVPERHGPEPQFYLIVDDGADQLEPVNLKSNCEGGVLLFFVVGGIR